MSWKDIEYAKLGQGLGQALSSLASNTQSKATQLTLEEQLRMNRERFEIANTNRNKLIASSLSELKASESRRGVIGATTGIQKDIIKQAEREERLTLQEMLATERNLMFAQELEKVAQKNAKMNSMIGVLNAGLGAAGSAGLFSTPEKSKPSQNNYDIKSIFQKATYQPPKSLTPQAQRMNDLFNQNKPLFSPNNNNGGLI